VRAVGCRQKTDQKGGQKNGERVTFEGKRALGEEKSGTEGRARLTREVGVWDRGGTGCNRSVEKRDSLPCAREKL